MVFCGSTTNAKSGLFKPTVGTGTLSRQFLAPIWVMKSRPARQRLFYGVIDLSALTKGYTFGQQLPAFSCYDSRRKPIPYISAVFVARSKNDHHGPCSSVQGRCYCYILHLGKISEDSLSKVFEVIVCNIFEKYQIPPTLTLKKFFKKFLKSLIFFLRFVYNHTTSKERVRLQCKGQRYRG